MDKGIESLKTAQQQLKVYRQAVLKWAFEGKFTKVNVKDGELPTGWKWARLDQIIQTLDQGWSPKCENRASDSNNEWAVIKTTAVQSGYFIETENKVLPKNLEPRKQHELRVEDILITRAGPRVRVGICCMVKHVRPKLINCDKVYRIKVKEDKVIPNYFALILNSPDYSEEIEKMKTGISDSGVNLTQKSFLQIVIKLPLIEEQHAIVSEIESRLSVCDKIEESIEQSLKQSESLRQSILKKAFEGKLVPQDPKDLPAPRPGAWFVYVLECDDGSYYKGHTKDIFERWKQHARGVGAEWTAKHPPRKLVHWEEYSSEHAAVEREKDLKTGFGRKWLEREIKAGRTRQAGEPAIVLLERIKAQREKTASTKRSKN